ncbi:MAG: putative lipid II flippase FtsW [SAR324 cluster bacterium]|nr:putative lipid II flippase FtsW [SAR324 cluster bacterium]
MFKPSVPKLSQYDPFLMFVSMILILWGTVMIYSTSAVYAELRFHNSYHFLQNQLIHVFIGCLGMIAALLVPISFWKKNLPWLMLLVLLMLIMVLIPGIGHEVKGGRRWIRLRGLGIQPSELLKITLIFYVASYLERKQEVLSLFLRGLTPNFLVTGVFLLLVLLQPDFGTVMLLSLTVLFMIYAGGARKSHILGSLFGVSLLGGILIATHSYRVKRLLAFLNPWEDPLDSGFQIIQSFIALGTGGWFGRGLGESRQKLFFLPDAHTDFIFAILGEEFGFLGGCLLILLFMVFIWRGYFIAWKTREFFPKFLAFGATTLIALQTMFNLGVVTGLLPTKGLPLPFVSFGGTSLLSTMFTTGLLLNVSAMRHSDSKPVANKT